MPQIPGTTESEAIFIGGTFVLKVKIFFSSDVLCGSGALKCLLVHHCLCHRQL